ncbi:MAG: hypothetical protein QM379_08320, partial [Acidobacteriota bacterium]|nr:hypothetical protein [Acidobacteriota bacterium]
MIERAGTEVAMMLIGSSGTDAPSTARRSSFGARPSLFGFAADGSDPDRTVYSTYDQGLLAQLLPYYIESVSYHPSGMTKEITHAKRVTSVEEGAKDTRTIADTMMARPESIIATPKSGAERSSGTYQYDGAGNIKAIGSDTYTYDKVSRLVGSDVADATSGTTMSQDATYDGYSNLTNIRRTIGAANPEDRALPADTATTGEIPPELLDDAQMARLELVEKASEADEELMELFLAEQEPRVEQIRAGLRRATLAGELVPVFCGSALKNKGVQEILDAIVDYLPSPLDRPAIRGSGRDGEEEQVRRPDDDEPFAALAFKILADPFA